MPKTPRTRISHNRPNGGLPGMTPRHAWNSGQELGMTDADACLPVTIERTVQRNGVRFLGLRYTSRGPGNFLHRRRGTSRKCVVKIDPQDPRQVLVFDDKPDEERWVCLHCTRQELVEGRDLRWWKRFCELARNASGLAGEGPQAPGNDVGFDFDDPNNREK